MAGDIVVFLGPTLTREEAASCLDAIYLPPAEQGSLVRAVRSHAAARRSSSSTALSASVPAVRHKEILWALAQDVAGVRRRQHGCAACGRARAGSACGTRLHLPLVPP